MTHPGEPMWVRNVSKWPVRSWLWPKRVVIPVGGHEMVDANHGSRLIEVGVCEEFTTRREAAAAQESKAREAVPPVAKKKVAKKRAPRRKAPGLQEALQ